MWDYLLLAGVALCALSVVLAVVQLLQTRPPRAAAILLVLGIAAILGWGYFGDGELQPQSVISAWHRVTGSAATAP